MKTYFKYLLSAFALLFAMAACDEEMNNNKDELAEGTLELSGASLKLDINTDEVLVTKAGTDVNTYLIKIYNRDTETLVENWTYNQVPEIVTLKVGNYRIEAHSEELSYEKVSHDPYYLARPSLRSKRMWSPLLIK